MLVGASAEADKLSKAVQVERTAAKRRSRISFEILLAIFKR